MRLIVVGSGESGARARLVLNAGLKAAMIDDFTRAVAQYAGIEQSYGAALASQAGGRIERVAGDPIGRTSRVAIDYNMLTVTVRAERIVANYRLLQTHHPRLMPVIKADAYGHGLEAVAGALADAGATTLCVGSVGEAVRLRRSFRGTIVALLGPAGDDDCAAVAEHDITPVVFLFEQLRRLNDLGMRLGRPLPVALKFDTGMARLGFTEESLPQAAEFLREAGGLRATMVHSHLAAADEPDKINFTMTQARSFARIVEALRAQGLDFIAALCNSAGILSLREHPALAFDAARPGIALYGANPFYGSPLAESGAGLQPAMEVATQTLQVRDLPAGESVSYGRTFVAPKDMRVAIAAAGYADCLSRGLTNAGFLLIRGKRCRVIGRVCMQLTAVDVTDVPGAAEGDKAFLLGGPGEATIRPEELAQWWGTIPYEVFCLLGMNARVQL